VKWTRVRHAVNRTGPRKAPISGGSGHLGKGGSTPTKIVATRYGALLVSGRLALIQNKVRRQARLAMMLEYISERGPDGFPEDGP